MSSAPNSSRRAVALVTAAACASFAMVGVRAQSSPALDAIGRSIRQAVESPVTSEDAQRASQQARAITDAAAAATPHFRANLIPEELLPRVTRVGDELRFGTHNVVSRDGESVIGLIRGIARAPADKRDRVLDQLRALSGQGNPEATTFMGFVVEYGLFGSQRDPVLAQQHYAAAASSRYQPALYNVALAAAYGKGTAPDIVRAASLMAESMKVAIDTSARVCGFGTFLAYRRGDRPSAAAFARNCASPLAVLPIARWESASLHTQLLEQLRRSTATGVDDGYALIEQLAQRNAANDPSYLYCKYALVNRVRARSSTDSAEVLRQAERCVALTQQADQRKGEKAARERTAQGIAGFVGTELNALNTMRQSNRFHLAWSVPYLPFAQADVDLFEPLMQKKP
jgi:hypothetical protein